MALRTFHTGENIGKRAKALVKKRHSETGKGKGKVKRSQIDQRKSIPKEKRNRRGKCKHPNSGVQRGESRQKSVQRGDALRT